MRNKLREQLDENPVIAAVKSQEDLEALAQLDDIRVVFILYGDVISIPEVVQRIHQLGKLALVHVDLINGLCAKDIAVDFIHRYTEAEGIISTKPSLIQRGKELGLFTVMRMFILDSMSMGNIDRQLQLSRPDFLEILPGILPEKIAEICSSVKVNVIAGGLISKKEEVIAALKNGACAISSTNRSVWTL